MNEYINIESYKFIDKLKKREIDPDHKQFKPEETRGLGQPINLGEISDFILDFSEEDGETIKNKLIEVNGE